MMDMYYANDVVKRLKECRQLVIFGAGLVAFEVANCLMGKPYQLHISYFMVSQQYQNPDHMMGISVLDLESAKCVVRKDAVIVVATMEKHLDLIKEILQHHGYLHIVPMTFESDLWSLIQGDYYREYCLTSGKPYLDLETELKKITMLDDMGGGTVKVYTAKCHVDKRLKEDLSRFSWEVPIQVGAALADHMIRNVRVRDDTGVHISHKNRQYCELTALYWIWKNDTSSAYAGVCHYRRHFELNEEQLKKLVCSDIDVVLTFPILNFPSVREVYAHDHEQKDWDIMLEAIRVLSPEYMIDAVEIQDGNYYYGYNMFIFRKSILNDYCAWLFPILGYCEEKCSRKRDKYQDRYIGFLAERLLTIYIRKHENELKIVHAKKHFIKSL